MKPLSERHPVDVYVGVRLRAVRRSASMSQEQLATVLGLTFQQIQKYETGANRISASKLYEAAVALNTSISVFFEGFGQNGSEKLPSVIEPIEQSSSQ